MAKTHDVTNTLGITNGKFGFETSHCCCRCLSVEILQTLEPDTDSHSSFSFIHSLLISVYEQRDAAEYFEKILCLTSPEAAKVETYLFIHLFIGHMAH